MDSTLTVPTNIDCLELLQSKRASFLATYRHHQSWSLPDSIIYYISKNPSSAKCYEKMIQTCKYFFIENPILVVSSLRYCNAWCTLLNGKLIYFKNVLSKLWATDMLTANNPFGKIASDVFSNIYQCDAKHVVFCNHDISFNDLKFLASKCETIRLSHVTVINENGSVVPLENIVAAISFVKYLQLHLKDNASKIITSKTASELIKIPHFSNIENFELYNIPEDFNIVCFYESIKNNQKTKYWLDFCNDISPAYRNRLQTIVNQILATQNRDYNIPLIQFPGNDETSLDKLYMLHI